MNKVVRFLISLAILVVYFVPITRVESINEYKVMTIDNTGKKTLLATYDNYTEALNTMQTHDSTTSNVAVIYKDNVLINAKYAIVNIKELFDADGDKLTTNVYTGSSLSGSKYTYIDGSYGSDAAFIDYSDTYNTVKMRVSGLTGWTKFSNVDIIPISLTNLKYIQINVDELGIRESYSTTSTKLANTTKGDIYQYYEIKSSGGYKWYRIKYNGADAWIANASDGHYLFDYPGIGLKTYYVNNSSYNELRHYYRYDNYSTYTYITLGPSPTYLTKDKAYYSFDGNYFYGTITDMLNDYKGSNFNLSVNKNTPYYNYYMYLPNHTKTGYTAENFNQILKDQGYTKKPDPSITYVTATGSWVSGINRDGISQMYGEGANFIQSQNLYGVNALLTFSAAINESGYGTSKIAFAKNNIFGHGAADSCPFTCATTYNTVKDSIMAHARMTGTGYNDPNDWRYYGSHYGNKGSGMGVNYASDPYWGEKMARNAYNRDKGFGGQDYIANTVGIKTSNIAVPIKKEPSDSSTTIYILKNTVNNHLVYNMPLTVFNKVYDTNNVGWYMIYTDVALDNAQNINDSATYSFDTCYGYVREDYLYVTNNQPQINANDLNLAINSEYNLLDNVNATDSEDGDLTSKIDVLEDIDITRQGTYKVTYKVTDDMNYSTTKEISVNVFDSNAPMITAINREVIQNSAFNILDGVTVNDPNEGDITNKVNVIGSVDITKVGTYNITYTVTNNLNITATKTITINVVTNAVPVIKANDIKLTVGKQVDFSQGVEATDLEDGIIKNITIIENTVNNTVAGTYKVVYQVTDSDNNTITKEIKVTVENITYTNKTSDFYFNTMKWNPTTNKLDVTGSLAIIGVNNTKDTPITYEIILKDNVTNYEISLPLERYLSNHPTRSYIDNKYKYTETWFKGSIDLANVPKGEYTIYVRARLNNYQTTSLFNNLFLKEATKKVVDNNGRGYLFRNNNFKREFPLELIVTNNSLVTAIEPSNPANMFNSFQSIKFNDKYLNIIGNSFNIGGNYSKTSTVTRYMIFQNIATEEKFTYNIGSIIGEEVVLKISDGYSKVRSWYDTTNKIDLSTLKDGKYIIYLRTRVGSIDDYGELIDLFNKSNNLTTTINSKKYTLSVDNKARYRVELTVESI